MVMIMMTAACSTTGIESYSMNKPALHIEDYFNTTLTGYGLVEPITGKNRQFKVVMQGSFDKATETLTLHEAFTFNDGEETKRVWTIKKTSPTTYRGTASDGVGTATGESAGNAFRFQYQLKIPAMGAEYTFSFDDWMFLYEDGVIVNRARMKKFGLTVAHVTVSFVNPQYRQIASNTGGDI